jgi:DNA-binding NarL/FixJ family response regulator
MIIRSPGRQFALLRTQPDDVICDATNGTEAVIQAMDLKPDVVVLDISMPGMNGLDAARLIKKAAPSAEILFLSQHAELETIRQAFRVGGRGYVVKSDAGRELISAIHAVSRRNLHLNEHLLHAFEADVWPTCS